MNVESIRKCSVPITDGDFNVHAILSSNGELFIQILEQKFRKLILLIPRIICSMS